MEQTPIRRRTVLAGIATGAIGGVGVQGAAAGRGRGRYVVGTATEAGKRAAASRASEVAHELDFGDLGGAVAGRFPEEALDGLRRRPDVRYVERDARAFAIGETLPDGIDRVDADVAHDNGDTGAGADIAIVDTGIDADHPDLAANLGEGYAVYDCASGCVSSWGDDNGHGTHCAGVAGADDNTEGVIGVSTEATLHAVKVLNSDGSGYYSDIADGIRWVADQGYEVASISLGGTSGTQTLRDACQYASENGVLLVGAAGNSGPCSDCVLYPAAYDTVLAVSAVDDSDNLADFSSTGPEIDLAAPGVSVLSTVPDDTYDSYSGTSMACPHVSGAAGQLMATGLTNTEAREQLRSSAEDLGLSSNQQGHGLLDVEAALDTGGTDTSVAVSTGTASGVGETTATLDGSLTDLGGASSADVAFEWGQTGSGFPNTTSAQTLSGTGSYSADLSALTSGTDYEFRAVATASDGDTDTGTTLSFTTKTADTAVVVTTDGASGIGETTATLDGSLTDLGGAPSADVYFEWGQTGAGFPNTTSAQTLSGTGSYSVDLSALTSGTDYEFRAVATASDGDTDTGTTLSFTTQTDPNVAVSTGSATNVGETTATLDGSLTDLGGASSADVAFEWGQTGSGFPNTTGTQTLSSTGSFSADLSGLSSGTDYEFRAVVTASDGDADTGGTSSFTTDSASTGDTVPAVDRYSVSEAGSPNPHAEITANWAVSDADGDLDSVVIDVIDAKGRVVDSARTSVSGSSASGSASFQIKHAKNGTFDVVLTVTDSRSNTATATRTVSE